MLCFLKEAQEYADRNNMFFVETSAKTADNINQLFEVCIKIKDYSKQFAFACRERC